MPKFNSFVYDLIAVFEPNVINGHCYANFVLSSKYKQEGAPFGFDWVRTGNDVNHVACDIPYKGHMGRNFSSIEGDKLATDKNSINIFFGEDPAMYKQLCDSYTPGNLRIFPSVDGKLRSYHVPVLSIYPYTGNPDDIAHLVMELDITISPEELYLEYDHTLFEINGAEDLETEYGMYTISISVKCIKDFSEDQYIQLVSVNKKGRKGCAGLMRVCKNAEAFRKQIEVLVVNIKFLSSPEEDAIPYCGDINIIEKSLNKYLRHALITPLITVADVDLGYKGAFDTRLIDHRGSATLIKSQIGKDGKSDPAFTKIHELLLYNIMHLEGAYRYDMIIFSVGTKLCSMNPQNNTPSFVAGYHQENVITIGKDSKLSTPSHEALHSLGLSHTFNNTHGDDSPTDYTYQLCITDNIMDYSHINGIARVNLWEWQWKRARMGVNTWGA